MNFLAHAYLSFNRPEILVGNLISDFVKGKKQFGYPAGIQEGIILHRGIDAFTDEHPATRAAATIFKPHYRLYSAAFIDIVYDHFLANDPAYFTDSSLEQFSQGVYKTLEEYLPVVPENFRLLFPYMQKQNWLYNYRRRWGIERSFEGLVRRSAWLTDHRTAFSLFETNYDELHRHYAAFFPSLRAFVLSKLGNVE